MIVKHCVQQRGELLEEFYRRYDWRLPVELTPSDSTFTLVARAHKKKSAEFIPLSRVTSLVDTKDTHGEHVRIKGTNGDLIFDPSKSLTKKNYDFNKSYESFNFAVRVLMYSYVLASCSEERGQMWCPLQSAVKHITTVEAHSRLGARVQYLLHPKVAEAEMTVRREWHRVGTEDPTLSLAALVEIVGQRYSIWPTVLDLQPVSRGRDPC